MHKLVVWLFDNLKNISELLSIICAILILAIVLCWAESIMDASWAWLEFIKPTVDTALNFLYSLIPIKNNLFLESYNAKFIIALVLIAVFIIIQRYLIEMLGDFKDTYCDLHSKYTKNVLWLLFFDFCRFVNF